MNFLTDTIWPLTVALIALIGFRQIDKMAPSNLAELRVWLGGALAAFIEGFIDGCPIGAPAGAGIAVVDGKFPYDGAMVNVLIGIAHVVAVPVGTGLADIRAWRKDHPFPNIFAPKSSVPPSPTTP